METKFNIDSLSFAGLPYLFIKILIIFFLIWAIITILDFFKIKYGIKDKSETADVDIWLLLRCLFKYVGIGTLVGFLVVIITLAIDANSFLRFSSFNSLLFFGIMVLFIAQGLNVYMKERKQINNKNE